MISEPRIRPPARPIDCLDAGDDLRDEALGDRRATSPRPPPGRPPAPPRRTSSSSTAFSIAASTEPPISSVCWIDAAHGRDHDDGHQREQAEHDDAGCREWA